MATKRLTPAEKLEKAIRAAVDQLPRPERRRLARLLVRGW